MINLMAKTWKEYVKVMKENDYWGTPYTNLLNKMEEAGMQPPTITILPNSYNRTEGTYGFEVNEWEPEDNNE